MLSLGQIRQSRFRARYDPAKHERCRLEIRPC